MKSTSEINSLKEFFKGFENEKKAHNVKLLMNLIVQHCKNISPHGNAIVLNSNNSISLEFNGFPILTVSKNNGVLVSSKKDINTALLKELKTRKQNNAFYPNALDAYSFEYEILTEYGNDITASLKATALSLKEYTNDVHEIKSVFQNIDYLFEEDEITENKNERSVVLEDIEIEKLVSSDENETIEFKQSLTWDSDRADNISFNILCKEVTAFLNSIGGYLIYGIKDNGDLIGIQKDLKKYENSVDQLELSVRDILEYSIGKVLATRIKIYFETINEKTLLILKVPSSNKPVYCNLKFENCKKHKHSGGPCTVCVQQRVVVAGHSSTQGFFVRNGNRANQLNLEEMLSYIKTHWPGFLSS